MSGVLIVPTGTANTASVMAALSRLGATSRLTVNPLEIETAQHVVVPGVGSFGSATREIDRLGVRDAITRRILAGRPTLAICVGMQLLAESSDESPGAPGLGVIRGHLARFGSEVQVPQFGWNRVEPEPGCRFVSPGWAYFANSYRMSQGPEGWQSSTTDHGGAFVSALEKGDVLACQFHPELSGPWGLAILDRWLLISGGR